MLEYYGYTSTVKQNPEKQIITSYSAAKVSFPMKSNVRALTNPWKIIGVISWSLKLQLIKYCITDLEDCRQIILPLTSGK